MTLRTTLAAITRCILCGADSDDDVALCPHHTAGDVEWAALNRLFCDLLHRGIRPSYPSTDETTMIILDHRALAARQVDVPCLNR